MSLSKLILGTVQLGLSYGINNKAGKPSNEQAFDILKAAQDSGVQYLDTANAYGDSQSIIREFHKSHPQFRILSKFKFSKNDNDLAIHLQSTLVQLGCQKLNTYSFHSFDDYKSLKDRSLLMEYKTSGIVENWGISIYTNQELEEAIAFDDIDVIQLPFNLLDNFSIRGALITKAKSLGKKVHVRSVFLQGLFFKDPSSLSAQLRPLLSNLEEIKLLAAAEKLSVQELALLYPLSLDEIDGVLIGVDTVAQLTENIRIAKLSKLRPQLIEQINAINCQHEKLLSPANWTT